MSLRTTLDTLLGPWHVAHDAIMKALLPTVDGTGEAGKVVTTDANGNASIPGKLTAGIALPDAQYSTAALQATSIPVANIAGAKTVVFENTGTTPASLQLPVATAIVAAIPGAVVGQAYLLKIRNSSSGANTATITTASGITLHGTMTIAQNVTRDFVVVLTSLTAIDVYAVGISAAGT